MSRRRILIVVLAVLAVVGLIFGLLSVGSQQNKTAIPNAVRQKLTQTQIGATAETIMKPGRAISTVVGPGTQQWWIAETNFLQMWKLQSRWTDLPSVPSSLGVTMFYSGDTPNQSFATPALFLGYTNQKAAQQTTNSFNSGKLVSQSNQYQALRLGNTALVVPTGIYTDLVFKNTLHFKLPTSKDTQLQEGYWKIDGKALNNYISLTQEKTDRSVYANAVKALGFNPKLEGTWYGQSKDGLHWSGRLTSSQQGAIWTAKNVVSSAFYELLTSSAQRIGVPTESEIEREKKLAENPNYEPTYFYRVVPRQSTVSDYFVIAQNGKTQGRLGDTRTTKEVKVSAPADKDKIVYTLDPNVWVNVFMHPDSTDLWYLFNYKKATLTFYKSDPTRLDVALTPAN